MRPLAAFGGVFFGVARNFVELKRWRVMSICLFLERHSKAKRGMDKKVGGMKYW